MVERLRCYVQGRWVTGEGIGVPLHDPTTEELIAEACTGGLDFRGALDHARVVGLPALQDLTFGARGALLEAMAAALHAHRDELLDLSTRSGGNTRSDAKFDVDGATATLQYYAGLGKDLGDRRVLADGDVGPVTRSPRYVGRHILVPRRGVAVHINAFNFPAWGLCEKLAVAWLAGLPVVAKPATSTAPLAVRMLEVMLDGGRVPDGSIALIAGSCTDLIDHLGPQDVLAFTGSCHTAWSLRQKRSIIENSVRVNVEADSLNAAVLGPDVSSDSDTWDLFLREVVRDMTQKAGQKCTAIRRILVPGSRASEVVDHLAGQLGAIRVGNPAVKEVRMGPLATAGQLADVSAGIRKLGTEARIVHGDGGRGPLHGVEEGKGYFIGPVLLLAGDPTGASVLHDVEVFGPVATVMPYPDDAESACRLVAAGRGGLVSSIYSDDRGFAETMVHGLAPYHGRLTLGSSKIAEHSPGPGTVLPALVHGGPGRAGGGEELGGLRGLRLYMQRTAIQGFGPFVESLAS